MNTIDKKFIEDIQAAHFRTAADTGANFNSMFIWNLVRKHVGLEPLTVEDLPAYCMAHETYHKIRKDYGCRPIESKEDAEKALGLKSNCCGEVSNG